LGGTHLLDPFPIHPFHPISSNHPFGTTTCKYSFLSFILFFLKCSYLGVQYMHFISSSYYFSTSFIYFFHYFNLPTFSIFYIFTISLAAITSVEEIFELLVKVSIFAFKTLCFELELQKSHAFVAIKEKIRK